jgi:hypothetical protein
LDPSPSSSYCSHYLATFDVESNLTLKFFLKRQKKNLHGLIIFTTLVELLLGPRVVWQSFLNLKKNLNLGMGFFDQTQTLFLVLRVVQQGTKIQAQA